MDTRFMTKREANGEKVFWGRGNGWVVGAFAIVKAANLWSSVFDTRE